MKWKFPLINFSLFEFVRRAFKGGRISFKGMFLLPVYCLQIIPTFPLAFLQFLIFGQRIRKTCITKDPVFIIGHYRSGTTLLQKLMVSDKRFGYLNYYDSLFPNTNLLFGRRMQPVFQRVLTIFKVKNPFFYDNLLLLSDPDEEDDYLMNKGSAFSAYWGFIFPRRWSEWLNGSPQFTDPQYFKGWKREYLYTIKYLTYRNNGKQLILKNPPNTERVKVLLEMFPKAKFIYIYRNPYYLYYSIRNMWKRAILKYYSVQNISDEELDKIVFEHFIYLTDRYANDKLLIPEGNLVEISYEALKADPFGAIRKIYSQINLPDFGSTMDDLKKQLKAEKDYRNFQYHFSGETIKKIEGKWGEYILLWKYDVNG